MVSVATSGGRAIPQRGSLEYAVLGLEEKLGAVEVQQFPGNFFKGKTTTLYNLFDSKDVVKGGWDKSGVPREKLLDMFTDYLPEISYHCLYTNVLANSIGAYEYVRAYGSPEQIDKVEGVGDSLRRRFQENVAGLGHKYAKFFTKKAYDKLANRPVSGKAAYIDTCLSDIYEYNGGSEKHVFVRDDFTGEETLEDRDGDLWYLKSWRERLGCCKLTKHPESSFRREQTDLYSLMTDWDTSENGWGNCGVPVKDLTRALAEYLPEAANYDPNSPYKKAVLRNLVSARKFVMEHGTRVQKAKLDRDASELDSGISYSLGSLFGDEKMLTQGWKVLGIPDEVLCNGLTYYLRNEFRATGSHTYLANAYSAADYVYKNGSDKQKNAMVDVADKIGGCYTAAIKKMGYSDKMADEIAESLMYVGWNKTVDNRGVYMKRNLECLGELSQAYGPDVGEDLHRHNRLNWFSRFTAQQLKTAYDNRDNTEVPYVLAISVTDDHNGSYSKSHTRNPWGVLDHQLPEGTIVRMMEVKSVKQAHAMARLARIQMKKYGSPMLTMLQLHADKDGLGINCKKDDDINKNDIRGTSNRNQITEFISVLKDILPPKSIFLVQGCQVGARQAVGQVISQEMDWTVVAAEESCHFDNLVLHQRGNQLIPELQSATWDIKKQRKRRVRTRIFTSGKEISRRTYVKTLEFPNQLRILKELEERRTGAPIGNGLQTV